MMPLNDPPSPPAEEEEEPMCCPMGGTAGSGLGGSAVPPGPPYSYSDSTQQPQGATWQALPYQQRDASQSPFAPQLPERQFLDQQIPEPFLLQTPVRQQQVEQPNQQTTDSKSNDATAALQDSPSMTGVAKPPTTPVKESSIAENPLQHIQFLNKFANAGTSRGPVLGNSVSEALIAKMHRTHLHSYAGQKNEPCRAKFQTTKLRSWRTGYARILSFHTTYFSTLDPDTYEVTNKWTYSSIRQYIALPKEDECILIEVVENNTSHETGKNVMGLGGGTTTTKLKFKCTSAPRALVLSTLLELKYNNGGSQDYPFFANCARQTRHRTRLATSLLPAPHGLIEMDFSTRRPLQTYPYHRIHSVSFTSDDPSGIVLYVDPTPTGKLFFIASARRGGNGRSDLLTVMKDHCEELGLELKMAESVTVQGWLERRSMWGSMGEVGEASAVHRVVKWSERHRNGNGHVVRELVVTKKGYLIERDCSSGSGDGASVVNCHTLASIQCVVRHRAPSSSAPPSFSDEGGFAVSDADKSLTIEYTDGTSRTYSCAHRDALIVSMLDAASSLAFNKNVTVTDIRSAGYKLLFFSPDAKKAHPTPAAGLFHPDSIPTQCLRRVHQLSAAAYGYLDQSSTSSIDDSRPINPVEELTGVMEVCREFNANVPPNGSGITEDKKVLSGTIHVLWGLVAKLFAFGYSSSATSTQKEPSTTNHMQIHHRNLVDITLLPILQALYRLIQTPIGYRCSSEVPTALFVLPKVWRIADTFASYWSLMVLSALLLPRSAERDREVEYVNKCIILGNMGGMTEGLVSRLLGGSDSSKAVSDLTLVVVSNILESVLCSNHDSTSPDQFTAFINALANRYGALMLMLRSSTSLIVENTALLLHLLTTHSPRTANLIRENALSSGILLQHFHRAVFSTLEGQRFLSRYLCSLWMSGPPDCEEKRLLERMVPAGFLGYLSVPILSKVEENQLDELEIGDIEDGTTDQTQVYSISSPKGANEVGSGAGTNTARLRSRIVIAATTTGHVATGVQEQAKPENFRIFFHMLTKDHALPDLIWNQQTRRELRIAVELELQSICRETEARGGIDKMAWNHQQFVVTYPSLQNEVQVGTVYMRLWLQAGDGFIKSWGSPSKLFELLFRRLLCDLDRDANVSNMCIRCLERLYSIHSSEIGVFSDIMILMRSMGLTRNIETQHRLLSLLATLLGVSDDADKHGKINIPGNAEQLLNAESTSQLCQFVAWGHTNSAQIGNLLTSLAGDGLSTRMITDGENDAPNSENANSSTSEACKSENNDVIPNRAANDVSCPAVWYIAPNGKVPPPAKLVRGPFRVSDLVFLIIEGEIHSRTLVSAAHVEDYSTDESSFNEANIDTGKWHTIEQVWQLRWQLFANGNTSGFYGPSDVAFVALRALARLVDLHMSVDYRGVPYFPIPIAKRLLCGMARNPVVSVNEGKMGNEVNYNVSMMDTVYPLSIVSQALLCNDARVVESAASLLRSLMRYNDEACAKLYLTGVFYFALGYTGSNIMSIAQLIQETHLKQHFRSGFAAAADTSELPAKDRSIVGNMLPQGVMLMLVNYGMQRFAEVFVGNFDNPEVIWSLDMRKHLIEMIRQHLGDFPRRLQEHTTAKYEYCPMPGIAYRRLEREIFCHNYYLNNLCDETRFPDWPISEPVEVFRACLQKWKEQMTRDQEKEVDAQDEARKILGLKSGDGGSELRKSYRSLARLYHPDKNPSSRDMFEKIQSAYELLLPVVEGNGLIQAASSSDVPADFDDHGRDDDDDENDIDDASEGLGGGRAQMQVVHLLMRTQLLICNRYADKIGKYKYPAYQLLLSCLRLPPSASEASTLQTASTNVEDSASSEDIDTSKLMRSSLLMTKRAAFVCTAMKLLFQTCLVSPLNAEELVSEGGIEVLEDLLQFYVQALGAVLCTKNTNSVATESLILEIIINVVHTISGVAYFESGRLSILALNDPTRLCLNWRRCLDLQFLKQKVPRCDGFGRLRKYALEGLASMARTAELQNVLIGCGVLWPLIRCMLAYDPTLDTAAGAQDDHADNDMSQAASNLHAKLAARALGMLCGVMKDKLATHTNQPLCNAMKNILTEPIARMLRNHRSVELLRTLNTNIETPVRVWNVQMREELTAFIDKMERGRNGVGQRSIEKELEDARLFQYSILFNEVVIGGVYIRVFTSLGGDREGIREIPDCARFSQALLMFIARSLTNSEGILKSTNTLSFLKTASSEETYSIENDTHWYPVSDKRFTMAVNSLRLLTRLDGLIDEILCSEGVPVILFSLLGLPQESEAFELGSEIILLMSPKQSFADAIAKQKELWRLLEVLEKPDCDVASEDHEEAVLETNATREQKGWAVMESLASSPSIAIALVSSSGWLELMGLLAGYSNFSNLWTVRQGAAKTLARLLWDPNTGPMAAPLLERFFPLSLISLLKNEGADTMLRVFDKESETPELIWDAEMRSELRRVITEQLDLLFSTPQSNRTDFSLPPNFYVKYTKLRNELFIGGVCVRLFLKEPTFNLRDPSGFLEMLLLRWAQELDLFTGYTNSPQYAASSPDSSALTSAQQDTLDLVTSASVFLCKVRPYLCDKLAYWGYMTRAVSFLHRAITRELIGTPLLSAIRIIHVASTRRANVDSLALVGDDNGKNGVVDGIMKAIGSDRLHFDSAFMIEALKNIFKDALGDVHNANIDFNGTGDFFEAGPSEPSYLSPNGLMRGLQEPKITSKEGTPAEQFQSHYSAEHAHDKSQSYAMAPSPAPGFEPVKKLTKSNDEHPLAMFFGEPVSEPMSSTAPNRQQAADAQHQPLSRHHYNHSQTGTRTHLQSFDQNGVRTANPVFTSTAANHVQSSMATTSHQGDASQLQHLLSQSHLPLRTDSVPPTPSVSPLDQPYQQLVGLFQDSKGTGPNAHVPCATQSTTPDFDQHNQKLGEMQGTETKIGFEKQGQNLNKLNHYSERSIESLSNASNPATAERQSMRTQPHQRTYLPGSTQDSSSTQSLNCQHLTIEQSHPTYQTNELVDNSSGLNLPQQGPLNQTAHHPTASDFSHQYGCQPIEQHANFSTSSQYQQRPEQQSADLQALGQQHKSATLVPNSSANQGYDHNNFPDVTYSNSPLLPVGASIQHDAPCPIVGLGIDARSSVDPNTTAEQKITTVAGAPGCGEGRTALLHAAMQCELPRFLVESVLENITINDVKDPASVKVHAVDLLKLLVLDPAFGMKFNLLLDKLPCWKKKYKTQDHSLFLTGAEQKMDYFLLHNGGDASQKMLTNFATGNHQNTND